MSLKLAISFIVSTEIVAIFAIVTADDVTAWAAFVLAFSGLVGSIAAGIVLVMRARAETRELARKADQNKEELAAAIKEALKQAADDKADLVKQLAHTSDKIDRVSEGTNTIKGSVDGAATAMIAKQDDLIAELARTRSELSERKQETDRLVAQATATAADRLALAAATAADRLALAASIAAHVVSAARTAPSEPSAPIPPSAPTVSTVTDAILKSINENTSQIAKNTDVKEPGT